MFFFSFVEISCARQVEVKGRTSPNVYIIHPAFLLNHRPSVTATTATT